jgi:hypothetical protein
MQKRIWLSGVPHWIGVYNDEPGEWVVVGEVRDRLISTTGYSEKSAVEQWQAEAAKVISRRT